MKAIVTWVLVADGGQARVFANSGPSKGLSPVKDLQFSMPNLQAREIMADRPGRSISSVGHGRSAIEPHTDPVAYREAEFVKSMAAMLDERYKKGEFDRLVIAAAPTALGTIRPALTPHLRSALFAELPKDLTNIPAEQLEKHFETVFAV